MDQMTEMEQMIKLDKPKIKPTLPKKMTTCPFGNCQGKKKTFFNLPRHLRTEHEFSKSQIDAYKQSNKKTSSKIVNPPKVCPLCGAVLSNLGLHLRIIHKMVPGSKDYLKHLKKAVLFVDLTAENSTSTTPSAVSIPKKVTAATSSLPPSVRVTCTDNDDDDGSSSSSSSSESDGSFVPSTPKHKRPIRARRSIMGSRDDGDDMMSENERAELDDYENAGDQERIDPEFELSEASEKDEEVVENPKDTRRRSPFELPDLADPNISPFDESLASYYAYLMIPHGGNKPQPTEVAKISLMAVTCNEDHDGTLAGVWYDEMGLWLKFFNTGLGLNPRKPTTLKGYSVTLQEYLEFLGSRRAPSSTYVLDGNTRDVLARLARYQPKWRKSLKKAASMQRHKQQSRDTKNLLHITEVKLLIQSQVYQEAKDKLLTLYQTKELLDVWTQMTNRGDATLVRNFLVFKLTLTHSARSGMVANATLGEFKDRRFNPESSLYEVEVFRHKIQASGPQKMFLSEEDVHLLDAYIGAARPAPIEIIDGDGNLFLTETGRDIPSSSISNMIMSFLKTCGVKLGKTFTPTAFRKMWVSHMNIVGKSKEDKEDMATLMKHSRTTAERWYDMTKKSVMAERAAKLITSELAAAVATPPDVSSLVAYLDR